MSEKTLAPTKAPAPPPDLTTEFEDLEPRYYGPLNILGQWYVVLEATPAAEDAYRSASLKGVDMEINDAKNTRKVGNLQGITKTHNVLVANCLYRCGKDYAQTKQCTNIDQQTGLPIPVGIEFVNENSKRWPSRLRKRLFSKIKEISELDDPDTIEDLEKELTRLQQKLASMREGKSFGATGDSSS